MTTDVNDPGWVPYAFAALQTVIVSVLGYISKLMRDIRSEIVDVRIDVNKHAVQLEEAEKREQLRALEVSRRLERVERNGK